MLRVVDRNGRRSLLVILTCKACHTIQIADDSHRIAVSQENFTVGRPDVNDLVPPHISASAPDTANPIASHPGPGFDRIAHDRLLRNRAQVEAQSANLNAVAQKAILKSGPRQG